MSTQHTPGPWYWIGDNALWSEKDGEVIVSGDDGKPYGMHSGEIHHHYDDATKDANKALMAAAPDLLEALIALRLHRASEAHYHDLAAAITILYRVSESIAKHRHLLPEIQPAVGALNAIFDRQKQRTVESFWSGTEAEIDAIQTAVEIYRAVILTTTGPRMSRVIRRVARDLTQDELK